ncbi:hypothetical protein HRbin11_01837 [bacterium HR11]|nr:hypothetical protein HRbin11_01837 [bacterium HR11]
MIRKQRLAGGILLLAFFIIGCKKEEEVTVPPPSVCENRLDGQVVQWLSTAGTALSLAGTVTNQQTGQTAAIQSNGSFSFTTPGAGTYTLTFNHASGTASAMMTIQVQGPCEVRFQTGIVGTVGATLEKIHQFDSQADVRGVVGSVDTSASRFTLQAMGQTLTVQYTGGTSFGGASLYRPMAYGAPQLRPGQRVDVQGTIQGSQIQANTVRLEEGLFCEPASLSAPPGGQTTATCTVKSLFGQPVDGSCAGLPEGVRCTLEPSRFQPPAGGTASIQLTLGVSQAVRPGTYPFEVVAGPYRFPTQLTVGGVTVDFSVSCNPSSLNVPPGGSGTSTCTVQSTGGFNSAVNLSCSGLPSGVSCAFSPNPVTPPPNGSVSSTLTVQTGANTPPGTYTFQVVGTTAGGLTRTFTMQLTVQQATFTLTVTKTIFGDPAPGVGTVTSSPAGINCGTTCTTQSFSFPAGTVVTLTATPASGYGFNAWSGDCTGTAPTCTVTMNSDKSVTADFYANPQFAIRSLYPPPWARTATRMRPRIRVGPVRSGGFNSKKTS